MTNQVSKLIRYEHWANNKICNAMSEANPRPAKTLELFSHILAVSSIWLSRAKSQPETAKRFDVYTIEECKNINNRLLTDWLEYIQRTANPDEQLMTFTMQGKSFKMAVLDSIHHVVIHGSYHRGQIVTLLKDEVTELPMTDFVLFALGN